VVGRQRCLDPVADDDRLDISRLDGREIRAWPDAGELVERPEQDMLAVNDARSRKMRRRPAGIDMDRIDVARDGRKPALIVVVEFAGKRGHDVASWLGRS